MPKAGSVDASLIYVVAGVFLLLALLPIYLFGIEAFFTQFNDDWVISSIASYYERNYDEDNDTSVILIIQKFTIPVFAGLSANIRWRTKYKKIHKFLIAYITLAIILIFVYEYVLSVGVVRERLQMFNISPTSLVQYFSLHKDPLFILLGSIVGLEFFQRGEQTSGEETR